MIAAEDSYGRRRIVWLEKFNWLPKWGSEKSETSVMEKSEALLRPAFYVEEKLSSMRNRRVFRGTSFDWVGFLSSLG